MKDKTVRRGLIYVCEVCGAEVMVLRAGGGPLDPHCCNRPMVPKREAMYYRCSVCGSEAVVLKGTGERTELICCNRPMMRLSPPAERAA